MAQLLYKGQYSDKRHTQKRGFTKIKIKQI